MASPHEPTQAATVPTGSDRAFGWTFAAVFLVVALLPLVRLAPPRWWAVAVAAAFAAVAVAAPDLLRPLNRAWLRFGELLQRVTNPLILGIIFFGVITPTGLIFRLMRRDLLRLKAVPGADSYWIPREPPGPEPESMRQPF